MIRVVVGGTFEYLHRGHRELLKKAFDTGDYVFIGITSDEFKDKCRIRFEERKRRVESFVKKFEKEYKIEKIEDRYGPTLDEDFDIIVVSKETRKTAEEINELRRKRGLRPINIVEIPLIFAEDLMPISSRRIRDGEIDEEGRRLKPLIVNVGSENPSKIRAVEKDMGKIKEAVKTVGLPYSILFQEIGDNLSGGERKRIELASVLLMKPRLAILDEPDSGIDILSFKQISNVILRMKEMGCSVLLITHSEDMINIADRATIICSGKVAKTGDREEIKKLFKYSPCPLKR